MTYKPALHIAEREKRRRRKKGRKPPRKATKNDNSIKEINMYFGEMKNKYTFKIQDYFIISSEKLDLLFDEYCTWYIFSLLHQVWPIMPLKMMLTPYYRCGISLTTFPSATRIPPPSASVMIHGKHLDHREYQRFLCV